MSVKQFMNQFKQSHIKGEVALIPNPVTMSVTVYSSSTSTIYAGSAVRLINYTSKSVLVDLCAAANAELGFVIYNPKKNVYRAGDTMEIALPNSVMWLECGETIHRGSLVEWYPGWHCVVNSAGTNPIVGVALDDGVYQGLIRVLIESIVEFSSSSSSSSKSSSSSSSCISSSSLSSSSKCSSSSSSCRSSSSSSSRSSSSSSSSRCSSSSSCRSSSSSSSSVCSSSSSSSCRSSSSSSSSVCSSSSSSSCRSSSSSSSCQSSSSSCRSSSSSSSWHF